MAGLWVLLASLGVALPGAILYWKRGSRQVGTPQQRATYDTLHTATLAASALRGGLTPSSSVKAAPALLRLLGTPAIAIADRRSLLAYEGSDRHIEALT
ncbi:MAG: sensor histidine kinase, partial [Micromonosporaceae bacterium]